MAVRVVIDGEGRECAALVDWPDWQRLADVARDALPFLFGDVIGGCDGATSDGDNARFDARFAGQARRVADGR
jgi:hypothetical protein